MRTALAGMTLGLLAILAVPAFAAAPSAPPSKAPEVTAKDTLFVESEEGAAKQLFISGYIRERFDYRRNFDTFERSKGQNYDWVDSRVQLGFRFKLNDNVETVIVPKVDHIWGGHRLDTNAAGTAVTNRDSDSFDLYEAYVTLHTDVLGADTFFRVGRQELVYDQSQMVLGNDSRYQGLSFDALRMDLAFRGMPLKTSVFASKVLENDRALVNGSTNVTSSEIGIDKRSDVYLFGLWNSYTEEDFNVNLYALLLKGECGLTNGTPTFTDGFLRESIYTVGANLRISPIELARDHAADLNFSIEGATQWGSIDDGTRTHINGAYALETELGVRFGTAPLKPGLAVGLALASGDEDPAGTDHTFRPLFENTENRLGDADQFSLSNLRSWYFKGSVRPTLSTEVGAAYYRFESMHVQTAVGGANLTQPLNGTGAYAAGATHDNNDVADEIDVYAAYGITKNVDLRASYAFFDPSSFITDKAGFGNAPASRFFLTLTVKW